MVVDHDAALACEHGRAGFAGAIEGVGRGRGGVQPAGPACDAKAVLSIVEGSSRQRTGAPATRSPMRRWTAASASAFARTQLATLAAAGPRSEQVGQNPRGSLLGHALLGVEIDGRRPDALAILRRRDLESARARGVHAGMDRVARCSVTISSVSGKIQNLGRSKTWRLSSPTSNRPKAAPGNARGGPPSAPRSCPARPSDAASRRDEPWAACCSACRGSCASSPTPEASSSVRRSTVASNCWNWTCPAFAESVFKFTRPASRTEAG